MNPKSAAASTNDANKCVILNSQFTTGEKKGGDEYIIKALRRGTYAYADIADGNCENGATAVIVIE